MDIFALKDNTGNMRILVIDDEMSICRLLTRLLIKEGHEVETFLKGQEV